MTFKAVLILVVAAIMEVGGDALVRHGLERRGAWLMLCGGITLAAYGFMVNMTKLDFGRLMGLYIVVFFLVAQAVALLFFHETPGRGILVGGSLVVLGGVAMTLLG